MSIKAILKKYPTMRILVVFPIITLKNQWHEYIDNLDFSFNLEIEVINTVIKHNNGANLYF